MDEKKYRLSGAPALSVPQEDADRLLAAGDGECALLYLQVLRSGGSLVPALAAQTLNLTEDRIAAAAERLGKMGLLTEETSSVPAGDAIPEYRAEDIVRRSKSDPSFREVVDETQRVLGHVLSGVELKTLFGIYDYRGLPVEVIMLLINYCAERAAERYGEGHPPTMKIIGEEARIWAQKELYNAELAEAYTEQQQLLKEEAEKLRGTLGIIGRQPTPTERKYMENWLAMGYAAESLAIAYDRTVVGTGRLSWKYMDKIVHSWYEKGLFTPEEIEKGDSRNRKAGQKQPVRTGTAGNEEDLDALLRQLGGAPDPERKDR